MNTQASDNIRSAFYSGIADRLVSEQLISPADLAKISEQAQTQGLTLIQELLTGNYLDSALLAFIISKEYGVPLLDLNRVVEE